jgi:hypothetical protein
MATTQQVQHYQSLAKLAERMLDAKDPAIYCEGWRINATPDTDDTVWFHVSVGPMSGGIFMPRHQARALAALLIEAAGGEQ